MTDKKPVTILNSWSSIGEKTVFVLDRASYFTQVSSEHSIDGDPLKDPKKTSDPNHVPIKPFDRSLWTCTVEAVVGYSRLVWDIFTPDQRNISILSVGPYNNALDKISEPTLIETICSWQENEQNLEYLMKSLGKMSYSHQVIPPKRLLLTTDIASFPNCQSDSISIINSLEHALSQLSHLTPSQIAKNSSNKSTSSQSRSEPTSLNKGRIILISSFQNEEAVNQMIMKCETMMKKKNDSIRDALKQQSESAAQVNIAPINYCDLVIINTFPMFDEGPCSKIKDFTSFKPYVHNKVYSVRSGRNIAGLLNNLCLQHHNLRSTTITGIPMKEEQNASSSSQYDVEIVHCSSIHEEILASDSPLLDGVIEVIDRNGCSCDTFRLSWCTPRNPTSELNHCVATSRITAVDVNSRPSACLTNFLLNGRTVMLEIFKSKSNRMTTHFLSSHSGELYIHSLATSQQRSSIVDPPSIADSLGGRVTDYRLNDFVAFMKQNTLCPSLMIDDPLNRTCKLIKRLTLYWPLTVGHTILLNVPHLLQLLLKVIPKETLSQIEVDGCKSIIDELAKHEKDGHALPSVSIVSIIKNADTGSKSSTKLEQLYKLLWNELEYFLRVHSTTPEHEIVLEYLLERRDRRSNLERPNKRSASKSASLAVQVKKLKVSSQVVPEINMANPAMQQSASLFKTGVSLWQTWIQLYHKYHGSRSKLPLVGRSRPPPQPAQLLTDPIKK